MNSPPNWEELLDVDDSDLRLSATTQNILPNWEELIDVDDSDLRLSATTQNIFSYGNPEVENCDERPVSIVQSANIHKSADIPVGVADWVMTQEYIRKVVADVGEDSDFNSGPWVRAVEYVKPNGGIMIGCFADIKKFCKKGKLENVVAIIKSCTPNVLGDLTVSLKDVSGLISGTIHHKVLKDERFEKEITVGAVLVLHNVSVFSPKQSGNHYLNITIRNVVKVFPKDTVPNDVTGVGGSQL